MVSYLEPMSEKPRHRGERDEEGATKAAILLFLADQDVQSFTDIRLYLRENFNIRSPKNLRIHLSKLEKRGLLSRCSNGQGKANTYRLEKSYRGIRALFNFFRKLNRENEIMTTLHFRSYASSRNFEQKVILNIFRTCILRIGENVSSQQWQEWAAAQTSSTQEDGRLPIWEWIRQVRSGDISNVYYRNFRDLRERYEIEDIDAIHSMFLRLMAEYRVIDPHYTSEEYMTIMVNEFILPSSYRERTFAMLQSSPGACDYILNRMHRNPHFPSPRLMGHMMEFLSLFPEVYDFTITEGGNTGYLKDIDMGHRQRFMERAFRFSGEPSTYMMIKSLFVRDLVYGDLVSGKVDKITSQIIE